MIIEKKRFWFVFILLGILVVGCRGSLEPITSTSTPSLHPTTISFTQSPTSEPYVAPVMSPPVATVGGAYPYPLPGTRKPQTQISPGVTESYPGPQSSPIVPTRQGTTPTLVEPGISPYPGPATSIPTVIVTARATSTHDLEPGTSITPTATARISKPLGTPPPPPSTITIWHSWRDEQLAVLDFAIQSFQDLFPDVYFDLIYIPVDELFESYMQAAYNGRGPSILFGPADWGPSLYDIGLVVDLIPYTSPEFLATINSAALETCIYRGALISLPHAQRGVLLIRNRAIISRPPESFEDMENLSRTATRGSIFGAYLERGAYYSTAHLDGLHGKLMDENFNPSFSNQFGVNWLKLLLEFNRLGPVSFNGNNDVDLFKAGKVGLIVDGSWNLPALADAIGAEMITVDPWPVSAGGSLSGYVQTDALFLNANIRGDEQLAALRFMGYLLDKEVQGLLSEGGFIPSVVDAQPQNELIRDAMLAFRGGTPYPVVPTVEYLRPYWDALNAAIQSVIERDVDPTEALKIAQAYISERLIEIRNAP
jgi:ABC-type glycerol-3-phosphate transport system substrate-binding protein